MLFWTAVWGSAVWLSYVYSCSAVSYCYFFFCYFENIITQKTWIDTTEPHPSSECQSVHSSFDSVFIILPLRLIASSNSGVSSVSTVFPVVARLPGDSDRGKQCFELFWLCNGRLASFCVVIQPSFLRDKPHPVTDWMESEACREPMYTWIQRHSPTATTLWQYQYLLEDDELEPISCLLAV